MNKYLNNKGYTFIEMICVLLLLSTILLVSVPTFHKAHNHKNVQYFFQQLELDLYESQMASMTNGSIIRFVFSNTNRDYTVRDLLTTVKVRSLPDGLSVKRGTLDFNELRYLPHGTISSAGTLMFFYKSDKYVLVFQLVRGRFYVEKNDRLYIY